MCVTTDILAPPQNEPLFWVPLRKSEEVVKGERLRIVEGVASDEERDLQGEIVLQKGMYFQPFLDSGFINWDHQKGPENLIGEPLDAHITEENQFFVKGYLYEGHPRADAVWNLMHALEKSKSNRRLGWSVEGAITQRLGKVLAKSVVRFAAITHQPVNPRSFAAFAKSMAAGEAMSTQSAGPLMLENLDGAMTSILWGDCKNDCFDPTTYRYRNGRVGALEHLVKCKGMGANSAKDLLVRLHQSGIF